jgi:hypothetical protein
MSIKLHYPPELLPLGHPVDLLVPFVGISNPEFSPGRLLANTFSEYINNAANYFEFTSIDECEVALLPIFYDPYNEDDSYKASISSFLDLTRDKKKKVFIFLDTFKEDHDIHWENAIIFTRAVRKSRQQKNVYSYPIFFEDYIKHYQDDELVLRNKSEKPVVGFCGYSPPFGIKFGKSKIIGLIKMAANYAGLMRIFPDKSSHSTRARVLWRLLRSGKVSTNFRIKELFAFGPKGQLNTGDTKESDYEFRKNFVNNIVESGYTVGVRGIRNTSIRFFETTCCGRIPLFINTDCVLPFDFLIDWNSLLPWVEETKLESTDDILYKFHENISNQEFIARQRKMRFLWKEYLSVDGFFKNIGIFLEHQKEINNISRY